MSLPYDIEIGDKLRKKLEKLEKKDKSVYNAIIKKKCNENSSAEIRTPPGA